jgi:hypothetical protein
LTKVQQTYIGEKIVCSTNSAGETEHPHVKDWM